MVMMIVLLLLTSCVERVVFDDAQGRYALVARVGVRVMKMLIVLLLDGSWCSSGWRVVCRLMDLC